MDPNQINQLNNLNNMSMYQNYLLNSDNKQDSQANLNLFYNYQQYYKGAVRNNSNVGGIGVNLNSNPNMNQMQNTFIQTSESPNNLNNITQMPLNYSISNSNALVDDTPNFNIRGEFDAQSQSDSSVVSNSHQDNQILSYEMTKENHSQIVDIENESNSPWNKASKDPSIIQKGTELFVGNLSLETTEGDLYETFKDCGEVVDIRVHKNHQNKNCYAFIRLLTKEMLKEAMNKNMTVLKGRKMKITKSNENSTIFIGNIRKNWKNADIEAKVKRIFPNCEKIENFPDPNNPTKNRGFCFVIFKNRNDAIKALNYVNNKGGINIDGVPLTCDWADVIDEDDNSSKQIFISGLNEDVSEDSLKDVFSSYGRIESIILSREHKNSKRKDLAFITYNTHEEAKTAVEDYKMKQENQVETNSLLGDRVCVSLAFSQQAMQNKKKIKESRRKIPGTSEMPNILPKSMTGGIDSRQGNIGNINASTLPNVFSPNLPQNLLTNSASQGIDLSSINPNSQNTTALLTMMNLLNMNKNNMNINPALFNQMMSACLESIMNGNAAQGQAGVANILAQSNQHSQHNQFTQNNLHSQHSQPGMQNFNRLNNFNNLTNPTTLNTLKSLNNFNTFSSPNQVSLLNNLNYPFSQNLNLGAPKYNNTKRTKNFYPKKTYNGSSFPNANNPNSA